MATQTHTYLGMGDPASTDVDIVRFTVQDVGDDGVWLLSDQEYQFLIDTWLPIYDSLTYVAAVAAATIARKFTGIVSVSADGVQVNVSDLAQRYRDLAQDLRLQHADQTIGGEVDITNVLVGYGPDPSIKPLRFGVGLHDNPEAGLQDYGGISYDPFYDAGLVDWVGAW